MSENSPKFDAYKSSKLGLLCLGRGLVDSFAEFNDFVGYQYVDELPKNRFRRSYWKDTGLFFDDKCIWVSIDNSAASGRGNYRKWSFPGYKVDRTPFGVVCHEFGHFVWLRLVKGTERVDKWYEIWRRTPRVTSYEPVAAEAFAETIRLFLTNSDLLKMANPIRYAFLTRGLGLWPVVTENFARVLLDRNVDPKILSSAIRYASVGVYRIPVMEETA